MDKSKPLACVIDDDEFYVLALTRMIEIFKLAESTIHFPNGEDAIDFLTMVKDYPVQIPDIIFLDINMPIMNGWRFLDKFINLKDQLSKPAKIYMTSSSFNSLDMYKAKTYGTIADYLIKPVMKADLIRVFKELQNERAIS